MESKALDMACIDQLRERLNEMVDERRALERKGITGDRLTHLEEKIHRQRLAVNNFLAEFREKYGA